MSDTAAVRTMLSQDLPTVLTIEQTAYQFPWSRKVFESCFREDYTLSVLELDDQIIGYAIVLSFAEEGHVLNFCIAPAFQRRGHGVFLLDRVLDDAVQVGVKKFIIEVRPSNQAAVSLYKKMGFRQAGLRKSYYPTHSKAREDAMVLIYMTDA